ncbi:MAG: hypothetical protein ACTSYC_02935 [Promethearchaeota archaeon]
MGIEELSQLEIINGIFTTLFVIVSLIVGLKILIKYFSYKQKQLITVGLAWMSIATPWAGNVISFLLYITFGMRLNLVPYLFIENVFVPLALIFWIYSFTTLVYPTLMKKLTTIFILICISYDIYLVIMLFTNPEMIGTLEGMFDSHHEIIPNVFRVFGIFTVLITGILFSRASMRSKDPIVQWKGRFFLIGIISFTIAAFLDAILTFGSLGIVLVRLLLISSAIEYYLGFFLPDLIANKLIKQEER